MDKLKDYLLRHRADLDGDSPAADTWENIASKMEKERREAGFGVASGPGARSRPSGRVIRYAAAACLIALAGVSLWVVVRNARVRQDPPGSDRATVISRAGTGKDSATVIRGTGTGTDSGTVAREPVERNARPHAGHIGTKKPARVPDEIDAIDKSYSSLIDDQLKKLRTTPLYAENAGYFSFYVDQFKQMDRDEQAVRNDIRTYGLTSEFLEQLINVYQQKLNVLKNLETEINKMNNKVRERQSPATRADIHYLNI